MTTRAPHTRRPGAAMERIRHALPSDTRLWSQRLEWSATNFVIRTSTDYWQVHKGLRERGWSLDRVEGTRRIALDMGPCKVCGRPECVPCRDGRRERVCDECTPEVSPEDAARQALYLEELEKQKAKREALRLSISARVQQRVAEQEAADSKPGRPRKRRIG